MLLCPEVFERPAEPRDCYCEMVERSRDGGAGHCRSGSQ